MSSSLSFLWLLVKSELSRRYSGRLLGPLWALLLPLLTILVIWVALVYGLRIRALGSDDYSADLVVGLMAWLFFVDAISTSLSSLTANPHLVKKVVFPIVLLPVSHAVVSLLIHICVVIVVCSVFAIFSDLNVNGLAGLLFWILCLWMLVTAMTLLLSAFAVLIKDLSEIVPAVLQVLFWSSPIVWPLSTVSPEWKFVLGANPIAIILQGYRNSINGSELGVGLTSIVVMAFSIGGVLVISFIVFNRMKVVFAEEL